MQKNVSAGEKGTPESFRLRIWRQGRNYSTLVIWLLKRAFRGSTRKLAFAIVLSLLHLASQAAAIFLIYWYGREMEKTGQVTVPFLDIDVNLKTEPQWLWAVVAISTLFFVVSAVLFYLSRRQILDVAERRYARGLEQLVLSSLLVPDPRVPLATRIIGDYGLGGVTTGCRRGAFTAISFATAITAVVGGVGAAIFLFRIDLPLTLLIVGSALVSAVFLYPLTLRAVKGAKDMEKARTAMRVEIRQLNDNLTAEETATSLDSADEVARSFMVRRRVLTELVFATEIGITILLGVVIYYMASQALAGKEQWAIFIAYIAALRMTLYGAAQAIRAFASVSRYYPQIVRYYLFTKEMETFDSIPLAAVRRGDKVSLGTLSDGREVVVEAGETLALLATGPLREPMYALMEAKLVESGQPVAAVVFDVNNVYQNPAGIALISGQTLDKQGDQLRALQDGPLKDKVTLLVYGNADKAGTFGEKQVLTVEDRELRRFAVLGTEEGDAVVKEFALNSAKRKAKSGAFEDDEEDEDV